MDKIASPRDFKAEVQGLLTYAATPSPSREVMAQRLVLLAGRVAGRRVNASHTPLYGHDSPANSYVVDDYPYGFKLRTQIRYWLEKKAGKGFRFMSMTRNPKTGGWNNPKGSTYMRFGGVMFLDEKKHVQWEGLSEYSDASKVLNFVQEYPKADFSLIKPFAKAKIKFLFEMIEGKRYMTINGVKQVPTEDDIGRWNDEVEQWHEAASDAMRAACSSRPTTAWTVEWTGTVPRETLVRV